MRKEHAGPKETHNLQFGKTLLKHEAAVLEINTIQKKPKAPHWKEEKVSSGKPPCNSVSKL